MVKGEQLHVNGWYAGSSRRPALETIGNQWMVKRELLRAGETKDVKIEPWQTMGGHQMIWGQLLDAV